MPVQAPTLEAIAELVESEPGLLANISQADILGGSAAARLMNQVIMQAIAATGINADGVLTPYEVRRLSDHIRADRNLYDSFVEGHGDDEGSAETGFHLVQGDGGALRFQGRDFIDTVADAIYHVGFAYADGRFRNEDGDANEQVDDIAGWLNYFVNGTHRIYGTSSSETLQSGTYSFVLADAANELFDAGAGDDAIWAGDGNDTVWGGAGNDRSSGQEGNDIVSGQGGNDSLSGGEGNDTVRGGGGDDQLIGDGGDDLLLGHWGHDRLYGLEGADTIRGGAGNDRMGGGDENDSLMGEMGNDTIYGDRGSDTLSGGDGDDSMGGGFWHDFVYGGGGHDRLFGHEGNDVMSGAGGADYMNGGTGDDVMRGGNGADRMEGMEGDDTLLAGERDDIANGGAGRDAIYGQQGNDTLHGLEGGDTLLGGAGRDSIFGGDGWDRIYGQDGNDTIYGGEGRDTIVGGRGVDRLTSYEDVGSRDTFVFRPGDTGTTEATMDRIEGFVSGEDVIDLRSFGGLSFVGGAAFSGRGRAEMIFDNRIIQIDANGDGQADAAIELRHVSSVIANDFLF